MVTQVIFDTLEPITQGGVGTAPTLFSATTDQTAAVITTAGAVEDLVTKKILKVRDILFVNYDVDGTPGQQVYTVTSTSSGTLINYLLGSTTGAAALTTLGVKRGTTATYGGGGTSNAFVATGLLSTDKVTATLLTSTTTVAIKAVPTTDTLTVTFSADPGANTTLNWIAVPA